MHYQSSPQSSSYYHPYYNSSSSSQQQANSFDSKQCLSQNEELLKYFNKKICQVCNQSSDGSKMLLCDKCEDGYHTYCIQEHEIQEQMSPQDQLHESNSQQESIGQNKVAWICPQCKREQQQAKSITADIVIEQTLKDLSYCAKCKRQFEDEYKEQLYFNELDENPSEIYKKKIIKFKSKRDQFQKQKCLNCGRYFHFTCFNDRTNSLNCFKCQFKIRKRCPKGHKEFIQYYKNKCLNYEKEKYLTLAPLLHNQRNPSRKQVSKLNLKLPRIVTSWQLITQYEASIYYAFQTKKLNFIEEQIYNNYEIMKLNHWNGESIPILELHKDDEKVFEEFKQNTKNGVIVGPYQIKESRVKGFHIVATDFIQKMTIITEYVGEVVSMRKSLFHHNQNDSVFILIKNSRSSLSLDIVPHRFGNIGRFFSGINNKDKRARRLLNVQALRFSYKGRVRIIFYASKNIQAGDQLYFDYNGTPFHEYPTDNFTA